LEYIHLPHLDFVNHYQFITFRTYDSTDNFLKKLSLQNKPNNKIQLEIDSYLDDSQNGAEILIALIDFLKNKDQLLYDLIALCIMPNHVHLLINPLKLGEAKASLPRFYGIYDHPKFGSEALASPIKHGKNRSATPIKL